MKNDLTVFFVLVSLILIASGGAFLAANGSLADHSGNVVASATLAVTSSLSCVMAALVVRRILSRLY